MCKDYFDMFHAYHCNKLASGPHRQFDAIRKIFPKINIIHTLLFEIHLIFALIISQTSQACLKFIASLVKLIHWVANS